VKKIAICTVALVALFLPCIASACHVTEVHGDADCNGWSLCTSVYFSSSVDEGSLAYSVTVFNGDGEEVTSFGETLTISHDPGEGIFEYCFDGFWDGTYSVSGARVVITSALDGEAPTIFEFDLDCTLDQDTMSFGAVKSMYR